AICTPPSTHAKLSVEAMRNNCHVLIEKPMALNVNDCDIIIDAAKKYNRKICVIHNQAFNPAFLKAGELISKKDIGNFLGMRIFLSTDVAYITSKRDHWAHKLPGGILGETGPHAVYLSLAFLNNVKRVCVHAGKHLPQFPWSRYEDFRIDLIADNGISSIYLACGSNQWAAEVDLVTRETILKVDLERRLIMRHNLKKLAPFSIGASMVSNAYQILRGCAVNAAGFVNGRDLDAHFAIISRFTESIVNNSPVPSTVTPQRAREVARVMEMLVAELEKEGGA
ncbi:MAG: Gfo/Idh/MocA family oxidoreductase, partial [Candidatus Omnitrophica bacterium]|nr:Gfo/Idh/MocA family oxidoreductase [Candidatus Omnitrophota bacterium]